jgi:hypothetical protein
MSCCALCAHPTFRGADLCAYHGTGEGKAWATQNRMMCDFVHRGIVAVIPDAVAEPSIDLLADTLEAGQTR